MTGDVSEVPAEATEHDIEGGIKNCRHDPLAIEERPEGTLKRKSISSSCFDDETVKSSALWDRYYDRDSFILAIRCSIVLTCSVLFVLIPPPSNPWDTAIWVFISASITTYTPRSDVATHVKKICERVLGTVTGGALGLGVGFLSLLIESRCHQAIFIGCMFSLETFLAPYIASFKGYRAHYGVWLINLTFGIVLISFYNDLDDRPWRPGVFRVANILIGCCMTIVAALVVFPISTHEIVTQKIEQQMKLAGTSSRLVLESAYTHISGTTSPPRVEDLIQENVRDEDAHASYLDSLSKWKDCRANFEMLKYDPFYRNASQDKRQAYKKHMKYRLARILRIQANVVQIDSMLRAGVSIDGTKEPVQVLQDAGIRIQKVLDLSLDKITRETAADELLQVDLPRVRKIVIGLGKESFVEHNESISNELKPLLPEMDALPSMVEIEGPEQSAILLRLVEHLIVRTVWMHHFCLKYEPPKAGATCMQFKKG